MSLSTMECHRPPESAHARQLREMGLEVVRA
jgi:hypothetical protein